MRDFIAKVHALMKTFTKWLLQLRKPPRLQKKMKKTLMLAIFMVVFVFAVGILSVNTLSARQNGALYTACYAALLELQINESGLFSQEPAVASEKIKVMAERLSNLSLTNLLIDETDAQQNLPQAPPFQIVDNPGALPVHSDFDNWLLHVARFRITVGTYILYESPDWDTTRLFPEWMPIDVVQFIIPIFRLFEVTSTIGSIETGLISVRMDSGLFGTYILSLLLGFLLIFMPLLVFSSVLSAKIAKRVSFPVNVLVSQMGILAGATPEDISSIQLNMKNPPVEISSIAQSLHHILLQMNEFHQTRTIYSDELHDQNKVLQLQKKSLEEAKAQIQITQTQLIQTQNMASIGQLTAAISHEINTPLGTFTSNVQLQSMILTMLSTSMQDKCTETSAKLIENIKMSAQESSKLCSSASDIVKSLKNYSRLDQADYQETNLNELIHNVTTLTRNLWRDHIDLQENYTELPPVPCQPGLLNQAMMNLMMNAIEAIPEGGVITITTHANLQEVLVSMKDSGAGVPNHIIEKLREPGFSYKKKAKDGTLSGGMGLSVADDIIRRHGGTLSFKNMNPAGFLVECRLPVSGVLKN